MIKFREKEHKKIVKYMRKINKSLANDEYLGLNRFRLDFFREEWLPFDDNSGGILSVLIKIRDDKTNNYGMFYINNYNYEVKMPVYVNDFLIRCSSGRYGHIPPLPYAVYDVHEVISYNGQKDKSIDIEDNIIDSYAWLNIV